MRAITCHECKQPITLGESAWASDWKVSDDGGVTLRMETRYTCDDCAEDSPC